MLLGGEREVGCSVIGGRERGRMQYYWGESGRMPSDRTRDSTHKDTCLGEIEKESAHCKTNYLLNGINPTLYTSSWQHFESLVLVKKKEVRASAKLMSPIWPVNERDSVIGHTSAAGTNDLSQLKKYLCRRV